MTYDLGTNESFVHGNEGVVVRNFLDGIKGGVVLDTTDYSLAFIRCGQIIIHGTSDDDYKPLPITDGAYESLPDGYEYIGVCGTTVPASAPFTSVVTAGEINENAVPISIDDIKSDLIAAMPSIRWAHD